MRVEDSLRNSGLQSLRGLAALVVLLHHSLRTIAEADIAWFVSERFLNAHSAVVVFFVLSGFVLTLSLTRKGITIRSIREFYIRRIFRIYPALWLGVAAGAAYFGFSLTTPADHLSNWVESLFLPEQMTLRTVSGSFIGVATALLPPLWTIKVELAASVILPLIVFIFIRSHRIVTLIVLAGLMALSFIAESATPLYMIQFALGAALAVNFENAVRIPLSKAALLITAIILVFFRQISSWEYHDPLPSLIEGCASVVLIIAISQGFLQWLQNSFLTTLGDWSYSLYLLHLPVAFSLARLASSSIQHGMNPDVVALIVTAGTVIITIGLSAVTYRWIERPGIALGRYSTNAIARIRINNAHA